MASVTVSGIEFAYTEVGSGPDVVLLHGFGATRRFWMPPIIGYLADRFHVIAYDLRGHGSSGMPPKGYTTATMAEDLAGLLDALSIERTNLVGHSFGGRVAAHFAALHPTRVARLAIVDSRFGALQPLPVLAQWPESAAWLDAFKKIGLQLTGEEPMTYDFFIGWLRLALQHATDEDLPQVFKEFTIWPGSEALVRHWDVLKANTTAPEDVEAEAGLDSTMIANIRTSTFGIFGARSFNLPTLNALRDLLTDFIGAVVPDAGHRLPLQRPFYFRQIVRAFLEGQSPLSPEPPATRPQ